METDPSLDARYLEIFPGFLRSLGEDVGALGEIVAGEVPVVVRRYATAAINYVFKSLDLIPDGIEDLGFLDDAFVVRVAASLAVASDPSAREGAMGPLADDARSVREFLGDDVYTRLEAHVEGLLKGAARGRTVDDVVDDAGTRATFLGEVAAWSTEYRVPTFTRDVKTLIKLKAFLGAKLR
jgi:uncharacterized membrane protein YkvA (DUF1232 family)